MINVARWIPLAVWVAVTPHLRFFLCYDGEG